MHLELFQGEQQVATRENTERKKPKRHSNRVILVGLAILIFAAAVSAVRAEAIVLDSGAASTASQAPQNSEVKGYTLPPETYARAVAYHRNEYCLYFVTTVYTLFLLWGLVRWRLAPRLRTWAGRISHREWLQLSIGVPAWLLIFAVFLLPTDMFGEWNMRRYGLSIQGWASWFGDWSGAEAATLIAGTIAIWFLYWVMRRSPRRWWLYLWATAVPLFMLFALIQPIAIDPLFNNIEPLDASHHELADSIEGLLSRAGVAIPRKHLYLVKVSDQSTSVDASSDGFGPTKSIFVWDTQIASEPGPALLHTMGHEIGHFRMPLDWIVFAICVPLLLLAMFLVDRILARLLGRWGSQWDIRGPGDWTSFPVLALILALAAVPLTPVSNYLSRYREHEADRFGLELIHGIVPNAGQVAADAFQKDEVINLADPAPPKFVVWWLYDHPPVNDRIVFLRTYDPWSVGKEPKYVK